MKEEKKDDIIEVGSYFDRCDEYIEFFDYVKERDKCLYFYYYEIGTYSFHSPISASFVEDGTSFPIVDIDNDFKTYGADIEDLLSVPFVKKVVALIENYDYTLIEAL